MGGSFLRFRFPSFEKKNDRVKIKRKSQIIKIIFMAFLFNRKRFFFILIKSMCILVRMGKRWEAYADASALLLQHLIHQVSIINTSRKLTSTKVHLLIMSTILRYNLSSSILVNDGV